METLPSNIKLGVNTNDCTSKDAAYQESGPEVLMQEGFVISSLKLKAKARKKDKFEVHSGRIIRSTGRKDRHSKVCTARGTRDRRVRLSPQTAISFYDVQDRLGYDRPSKAIDWLMKEAKAAIDALDEPPPAPTNVAGIRSPPPNSEIQKTLKSGCGFIENKNLDDDDPISSFGFFTEAAALPSSTEFLAFPGDGFTSSASRSKEQLLSGPLANPPEIIFDTNLEIARLQRISSSNYNFSDRSPPLHFPAEQELGHGDMFSCREPLQSSYSRISNYSPFSGMSFFNEALLNFNGTAATFKEDHMGDIPVSSKSFSTPSFLDYED